MIHTKLIKDIDSCDYSRCGRTDKGVSAFGQVIGVKVRSNQPINSELLDVDNIDDVLPGHIFRVKMPNGNIRTITEIDYDVAINRSLPDDIRVYSAVAVPSGFSARFDCHGRLYRYFFVKKSLDIAKMQIAANKLVGDHDYRNFCRIDTARQTYERTIHSFDIIQCEDHETVEQSQQMYRFEIRGGAFLWHQVRCMVQILFFVGEGREEPEIIDTLLDIETMPRKPQYDMASDTPLCLQDCLFKKMDCRYTPLCMYHVYSHLNTLWEEAALKTAMLRSNLDMLESFPVNPKRVIYELDHFAPKLEQLMTERGYMDMSGVPWKHIHPLLPLSAKNKYMPLSTRETGFSVQERKDQMNERKRRRVEMDDQLRKARLAQNNTSG